MVFWNLESLGSELFLTLNLKIIKLYIDRLDIAIPCGHLSVSLIQICNQTAGQSVIIQPQLKDSQTSVLCPKMYKCSQETITKSFGTHNPNCPMHTPRPPPKRQTTQKIKGYRYITHTYLKIQYL